MSKKKKKQRIHKKKKIIKYLETEKAKLIELLPSHLRKEFKEEAYVSGGSIYSLYNDKPINDIDFFIETLGLKIALETYFKRVEGLVTVKKGKRKVKIGTYKSRKLVVTDNAITIGNYQIILRDYGVPKEVIKKFDFKHNMYYVKNHKFYNEVEMFYLELDELRFNDDRARNMVGTLMRIPKFVEKGFTINQREVAKMLLRLNDVGFTEEEIQLLKDENSDITFSSGS